MTSDEKVARRKLSLLELAQDLGNVSRACKVMATPGSSSMKSGGTSKPMALRN